MASQFPKKKSVIHSRKQSGKASRGRQRLPWKRSANQSDRTGAWRQRFEIHFRPPAKQKDTGQLKAAIEEVDITPFPGVPKGGYAAMSQTAVGFRSRIRARVFYICPPQGQSICLLQADLHAGSALIRNLVAEKVAAHTDIHPANVMMTCTHTHSGPGQLLESDFYNRFASNKPGLDWELLQQITDLISDAAIKAYENRKPARIASGSTEIFGLTRNRSMVPYLNNAGTEGEPGDDGLKYKAVNPTLHLLRFDLQDEDGHFCPAGAFSNFSIHGTCVPAASDVFSADSWAYVSGELEGWIQEHYNPPWKPIHGPSQGTHGDNGPDVADKNIGVPEARRIGTAIAEHAARLFAQLDDRMDSQLTLRNGIRQVDFYQSPRIDDVEIASRPMLGTALVAGAYEHSTPVLYHMPFFKHGFGSARLFSTDPEQGHKRKVAGDLQKLLFPKKDFPHQILFQTLQIGKLVLVGVPFEVTCKAGEEIADAVRTAISESLTESEEGSEPDICVASLTNGYTGYTATASEYEKQYYEGGHTLYGPNSNRFIAAHCCHLMRDTLSHSFVADMPDELHYDMQCRQYQAPVKEGDDRDCPSETGSGFFWSGQPVLVDDPVEPYWRARYRGPEPWCLDWHDRLVAIETLGPDEKWQSLEDAFGRSLDDRGYDIEIRYQKGKYELRWYPRIEQSGRFRFVFYDGPASKSAGSGFDYPPR